MGINLTQHLIQEDDMSSDIESVDYDGMDDLVLSDHIEFNHDQPEEFFMDAFDIVYGY